MSRWSRLHLYGYRHDDEFVTVGQVPLAPFLRFGRRAQGLAVRRNLRRKPVGAATPFFVEGMVAPKPDGNDSCSLKHGVQYRMCRKTVHPTFEGLRIAARVARALLKSRRTKPITKTRLFPDTKEFEDWLQSTTYGDVRKAELREVHGNVHTRMYGSGDHDGLRKHLQNFVVKLFAKEEHYTDFKAFRGIYARNDPAKVLFGHWISHIEEQVYKWPEFIKKVPLHERPNVFKDMFGQGDEAVETDYSSWEAHFITACMVIEKMVFGMILTGKSPNMERIDEAIKRNLNVLLSATKFSDLEELNMPSAADLFDGCDPSTSILLDVYFDVTALKNAIQNKDFSCVIVAMRMSGEMTTSLLNGIMNLIFYATIIGGSVVGCGLDPEKGEEIAAAAVKFFSSGRRMCVVEGDDLLGVIPRWLRSRFDERWYTWLGLNVKLERHERWGDASFCGMRCDPEDLQVITDLYKVLGTYGWVSKCYARSSTNHKKKLALVKALSYAYQYPGCPIVGVLARKTISLLKGLDVSRLLDDAQAYGSKWHMQHVAQYARELAKMAAIPHEEPTIRTRELFERVNKVSVEQQIQCENWINSLSDVPDGLDLSDWITSPSPMRSMFDNLAIEGSGEANQFNSPISVNS